MSQSKTKLNGVISLNSKNSNFKLWKPWISHTLANLSKWCIEYLKLLFPKFYKHLVQQQEP
jgi:hypothetical protein